MSDEATRPNLLSRIKEHLNEAPLFCKIIETIFCVVAVGLIVGPFNGIPRQNLNHVAIVYVSLCGFILINGVLILSHLLGEKIPKKMALNFSGMGTVLCTATGIILIRDWIDFPQNLISRYLERYSDQMIASGVFALFAAFTFFLDTYFTNKYHK